MRASSVQLAVAAIAVLFLSQSGHASAATTTKGAELFKTNCMMCHAENGAGSEVGKSIGAPDLRSRKVQSNSDAALARFISDGNGAMPSFKDRLSHQEILDLVHHVRKLGAHR
jgi:mono/diheme cytochrome c family protein